MAIAGYDDNDLQVKNLRPTVDPLKNKYRTVTITNDDTPLGDLIQYISGNKWTVDYFLQQLAADDASEPLDVLAPDSLQQYVGIHDLILNLESPLPAETLEGITGTAIVDAGIVPQVNDILKATLLDNREAMFIVTNATRKNYTKEKVYEIDFKLDHFVDSDDTIYTNLIAKTVKEYYYDRSFNSKYSTPLLLKDDFENKQSLKEVRLDMLSYYFNTMYSSKKETLLIGQPKNIADKLLENFIFRTIDVDEAPMLVKINTYSINDDALLVNSVWNMILKKDINMLKYIITEVGYIPTTYFTTNPSLLTPKMLGIDYVVYPKDIDSILAEYNMNTQNVPLKNVPNPKASLFNNVDIIPKVNNIKYLFSPNFYVDSPNGITKFESVILRYVKGEVINYTELKPLIESYMLWDRLEQQYYIPILLLILKDTLYNMYSV